MLESEFRHEFDESEGFEETEEFIELDADDIALSIRFRTSLYFCLRSLSGLHGSDLWYFFENVKTDDLSSSALDSEIVLKLGVKRPLSVRVRWRLMLKVYGALKIIDALCGVFRRD